MQAQRIDSIAARERCDRDELDSAQSAVLAVLLGESHHGLYSRDELQRTLSAGPLTVADAIAELIAKGLVHSRATDEHDEPVFLARGGVAIELRSGERARATRDVDLLIRTTPESLLDRLDEALAEPYQEFSFQRSEPERLPLRPQVRRVNSRSLSAASRS